MGEQPYAVDVGSQWFQSDLAAGSCAQPLWLSESHVLLTSWSHDDTNIRISVRMIVTVLNHVKSKPQPKGLPDPPKREPLSDGKHSETDLQLRTMFGQCTYVWCQWSALKSSPEKLTPTLSPPTMNSKPPFSPSLDMDLKISHIECLAKEILVKFQGKCDIECEFDYHILQSEIQHIPKAHENVDVGEFCLVEERDSGEWHRGQVVENINQSYKVFLIDCGKELRVSATRVASARDNLFELPPRMVVGVFANILPLGEKWSPKALNYFMSLVGLQVKGHVQAILPHQMVLLEVPRIISELLELQLGRLIDGDSFRLIIEMLKESPPSPSCSQMPDLLKQPYQRLNSSCSNNEMSPSYQHVLHNLQPSLSVNCTESVKIASAVSPGRFYCHLMKWLPELENLTAAMSLHYEAVSRERNPPSDNFGLLCVAKRRNRRWYRGVLQQLLPHDRVKIWFMDLGSSEAVPSSYVKKLKQEFSLVPLFSFPCSLSHFSNPDKDVRHFQLKLFKQALLGQTLFAHIDQFDPEECLYYVTFHNQESMVSLKSPLQANKRLLPRSLMSEEEAHRPSGDSEPSLRSSAEMASFLGDSAPSVSELDKDPLSTVAVCWKTMEMKVNSAYVAFVEYVLNPSNFWVRTNDHQKRFQDLMKKIGELYDPCEKEDMVLKKPEPGLFCCARYQKDMHFYRAVITEVNAYQVNVYFLDFGNTESVPFYDVKILLREFCELPALAMCCSLAHAYPIEDIWVKKATDFFKKTVFDKALLLKVVAKKKDKYIVNVQCIEATGKVNVVSLMVQAGYAEYWEVKPECLPKRGTDFLGPNLKPGPNISIAQGKQPLLAIAGHSPSRKSEFSIAAFARSGGPFPRNLGPVSGRSEPLHPYKEYMFKPGTVIDVKCSYFSCPGDFSCQLQSKLPALMLLMEQMQKYYGTHSDPYQAGQVACVARYAKDGKWYRAAVVTQVSPREVVVIFVDYGNQERILIKDLCAINPDFLILEGQAFRCSLNNLIEPTNSESSFSWTTKSCIDFGNFISSYDGLLTCIIYALVLIQPNCLCNIVDLRTPFTSAREFLVSCGCAQHSIFSNSLPASVSLYSFCYSSFNLKIGSEEEVYISHIQSPKKFYCQLRRNSQSLEVIGARIAEISNLTKYPEFDGKTRLCLSRYFEDGLFYRAVASPVALSSYLLVYFVDFGNKQIVEGNTLVPLLDQSPELLFTPMQAIKCYLSDLRDVDIPSEISIWFEENFLGKPLKAVVVSRDSDAQLGLELYDGCQQINHKIKTLLQVYGKKYDLGKCVGKFQKKYENKMLGRASSKDKAHHCHSTITKAGHPKHLENKVDQTVNFKGVNAKLLKLAASLPMEPVFKNRVNQPLKGRLKITNGKPSPESASQLDLTSEGKAASAASETRIARECITLSETESVARPQISDLPPPPVRLNARVKGYISNIWSPASFHIQLAESEDLIFKLGKELNERMADLDRESELIPLSVGDLVAAKYVVDDAFYRAVIKSIVSRDSLEVEFIDYGNTETVSLSRIRELDRRFLTVPPLCLHSFLSGVRYNEPDRLWDSKTVAYFAEKVNNKLMSCEFLKKHEQKWEVNIICDEKCVVNEMMKWIACSNKQEKVSKPPEPLSQKVSLGVDNKEQERPEESKSPKAPFPQPAQIPSPELKPGQLERAEILYVLKCGNFSVKLSKNAQVASVLLSLVVKEAKESPLLPVENIEEGSECLTRSRLAAAWCRAKVEKRLGEEKMLVYLMDCGLYEVVPLLGTKELSRELRSIPQQAVPCKWIWIENARKMSFEATARLFARLETKILFLRYLGAAWEVEILVDGLLLLEYLSFRVSQSEESRRGRSEIILGVEPETPETSFRVNSVKWAALQSGRQYGGFATAICDPSDFSVQLEDFFDTMVSLCRLLLALPGHLPTLPPQLIIPGASCLFRYGWEGQWHRVEISEVSTQSVLLLFMDYGFSVCVPHSECVHLKVIPEELLCLPRLTYRCALHGVLPARGDHWEDAAKAFFQDLMSKPGLFFLLREYCPGIKLVVEVMHGKNSLADLLVLAGHAVFSKEVARLGAVNSIQSTKIECKLQGRHFYPLLDKVFPNDNVLLMGTGKEGPQQRKLIPWKDVYRNIFGKPTPSTCLHSRNLTMRKKVGSGKHRSKSTIKFEMCERNTLWEPHGHLTNEPRCIKNIPENLPPGDIWRTYNLCTRIKSFNVNEEMLLEENPNKEGGENSGHLCISLPTTVQKETRSGSLEACCSSAGYDEEELYENVA
ncbi:tudor domain-containing protein 15 [Dromiciops gliroides]|uniref:tudor domain-containing protein 15 n=1 Tax=Dromiciops gliroides TaxID=33562 RepID=UPI001CC34984|nr:tudor domain-containing protein 15 [Dromiciops gliroides]